MYLLLYAFFDEKEVTVYFTEGYISDDFTGDGENEVAAAAYSVVLSVYGRNGQAAQISLNLGAGVVDKLAPEAKVEYKLLYHKKNVGGTLADYDEPYSCTATITFSEDVYLSSEDIDVEQGKLYIASTPLEVTLTDSESHYLSMTDKAGNQTKDLELNFITPSMPTPYPVLDSDPPELSIVAEERDSNNYIVFRVRVDDVNYIDSITADDETNVEIGNEDGDYDAEQNYYTYYPVTVKANGGYRITVTDAAGNSSAMTVMVSGVDLTLPTIIFETPTVAVRKGSTEAQLQDLLDAGVTLWDNVETDPDDPTRTWKDSLAYDTDGFTLEEVAYPAVDLNTVGTYSVQYTVTDLAGNVGMAIRHVRVLPDNLPEVKIDGRLTELNGTLGLGTGEHTLTVEHRTDDEPYTVKLARGLWSGGQIKYVVVDIPVGADGKFTLPSSGFYTLYILTQSRVSYRTLLYAGN